ncbi:MAG: hypothetical protein GY811_08340, partial [Myxococcales bacterium]|nr:hypothetical protein [Myxococcales bacterium]
YLLRAFTVEDREVQERASLYLNQWVLRLNRVFTSPSTEIERESREQEQAAAFSDPFRQEIEAILDSRSVSKGEQ